MKKRVLHFFVFCCFLSGTIHAACMSGTYTIGGMAPDFSTFPAAISALVSNGVCGPVTFNVRNGLYPGGISINSIPGASAVNRIVFQSENLDSTLVRIQSGGSVSSTANYTIQFNGADYVTFRKMTINRVGSSLSFSYCNIIAFTNGARFNTIENCRLEGTGLDVAPHPNTNACLIYSTNATTLANDSTTIRNNLLVNGTYGILLNRSTSSSIPAESGWKIINNQFTGQRDCFISATKQASMLVEGNRFFTLRDSLNIATFYGISMYYCKDNCKINSNQFYCSRGIMLNMSYCTPAALSKIQVVNNMMSASSNVLSVDNSSNLIFYHNSFRTMGLNTVAVCSLSVYSGILFKNNIFVHTNGGKIYAASPLGILSDYNDYYTTGAFSPASLNLAAWVSASGQDLHSLTVNPPFVSPADLHISASSALDNHGDSLGVVNDLDGNLRSSQHPDIGADEFYDSLRNDIGASRFITPSSAACHGVPGIRVEVVNHGQNANDTIRNFRVFLKVNSSVTDSVDWHGLLLPGDSIPVLITAWRLLTYGQSYQLKAWTSQPNGSPDSLSANDTAYFHSTGSSMGGIYTLGGLFPDFRTFNEAKTALQTMGVCDSVTILVRSSLYVEQLQLDTIPGASVQNTITFRSQSGDSNSVYLGYFVSALNDNVLMLNGTDHIRFRHITIGPYNVTGQEYQPVIIITAGATDVVFSNNVLKGRLSGMIMVPMDQWATVLLKDTANRNIYITQNRFVDAWYGLATYTMNYSNVANTVVLEGNDFFNLEVSMVYVTGITDIKINRNRMLSNSVRYGTLVYLSGCDGIISVTENYLSEVVPVAYFAQLTPVGISLDNCSGSPANPILIANNYYINHGGSTSRVYGIALDTSSYVNIVHNTISIEPGALVYAGDLFACLYLQGGRNIAVNNNILSNYTGDLCLFTAQSQIISSADYNLYYSANNHVTNLPSNSNYPSIQDTLSLQTWHQLTGLDAHSAMFDPHLLYRNPAFNGAMMDLHLDGSQLSALYSLNYYPDVPQDYDHDVRSVTPMAGADEYVAPQLNAGMRRYSTSSNCPGLSQINATIRNNGTVALNTLDVNWKINTSLQPVYHWSGMLAPGDSVIVPLGSYSFAAGSYSMKIWSSLPNNSNDQFHYDDTLSSTLNITAIIPVNLGPDIQICPGATASLNAGNYLSYLWSNGSTSSTVSVGAGISYVTVVNGSGCSSSDTISVGLYSPPTVAIAGPSSACSGATVMLAASGATSYIWNTGATSSSISAAINANSAFSVIGTDAHGCSDTANITVQELSLPVVTITAASSSVCAGMPDTLFASGAATYVWFNNSSNNPVIVNPSTNTTYSVTGTGLNGCSNSATFPVTVHQLPVIAISGPTQICAGDSVTLVAGGASAYAWTTGSTNSSISVAPVNSASYGVTGTDNFGCTGSATIAVQVNAFPSVQISGTASSCYGTSGQLTASGANFYTWSTGASGQQTNVTVISDTLITVYGTDLNGCSDTGLFFIHQLSLPQVVYQEQVTIACVNWAALALSPGQPSGGVYSGPGVNGSMFDPALAGAGYQPVVYSVADSNGCVNSDTSLIYVDLCLGTVAEAASSFMVYPNPFFWKLTIECPASCQVIIRNTLGQVITATSVDAGKNELSLNCPSGLYWVTLLSEQGEIKVFRLTHVQ